MHIPTNRTTIQATDAASKHATTLKLLQLLPKHANKGNLCKFHITTSAHNQTSNSSQVRLRCIIHAECKDDTDRVKHCTT